ncbi:uncharacterized protein LOC111602570 [Drosophila hydei]|uniref:Uncharacterized protein LOC111602570 n=1 Tax=Drosophila hydei TaxID=7224 RepID=A0A6J1M602_DROHY|nr:uncharacterized protein LOC111602570 [Drosophila hydei]
MNNEIETETDATLAKLTSTSKVLTIGDPKVVLSPTGPEKVNHLRKFKADCTNYLSLVLMGNPTPIDDVSGFCPIEWFGMETITKPNQPTRYQFYCFAAQRTQPKHNHIKYFYQTINANAILRDVRQFLRKERWISKYVLMGPLKAEIELNAYSPEENHVLTVISKAFDIERAKVFPYLMYFHRERVQNKLNR